MKKSNGFLYATTGTGIAMGVAVLIIWSNTPWWVYLGIAVSTLIAVPEAIKSAAEQKIAKKIWDE